jgi:hypothetical protein
MLRQKGSVRLCGFRARSGLLALAMGMGMSSVLPAVASGQASVVFADGADALDISNAPGAVLEISNNHVILNYTTDPKTTILGYLSSGTLDLAYTEYGDITLSGLVNANDFHILSSDFGQAASGGWEDGDFPYAGTINAEDFHLLTENFGETDTAEDVAIPAADWAAIDDFAAANGLTASSNVPEPASVGLLTITSAALLRRRRFSK